MNIAVASTVRPLSADDMAQVAGLFTRIFLKSNSGTPAGLADYLKSLYLDAPWSVAGIASLVHQRADGTITGFIGAIPVPLQWGERQLTGAICTALMVEAHESDPMAGARLLRASLAGPQDVSICETASDTTMAMWRRLNGVALPMHSLGYLRVLRPFGALGDMLRQRHRRLAAPFAWLAAPLDALVARLPGKTLRWWSYDSEADPRFVDEPVDPRDLLPHLPAFMVDYAIRPDWSEASYARILSEIEHKPRFGTLTCRLVRTKSGQPVGAFIYHGQPGRTAHVTQLFASRRHAGAVLDRMFTHAARAGMAAVAGRTEPHLMDALLGRKLILSHNASSGVHARDPGILAAFEAGQAYCNGIAGEGWSRLIGDDFRDN